MKTNFMRILAALLVAVTLLGAFTGCNSAEPAGTNPGSSIGSTENTGTDGTDATSGSTGTTTGTEDTTGTTGSDPAGNETISGTETTAPSTNPSTDPSGSTSDNEACAHKYSSWTVKKEATCTAEGYKTRICSICSNAQQETISATGHSYGSWTTTKAATCDTNGLKTRTCSKCSNAQQEVIAATGHTWDEGKVTTTPTSCSDMGVCTYTCTVCGKTKTTQIKGNHSFGDWTYEEYTYKQDGVSRTSHRKVRSCTKCGYSEYGNTPDHPCTQGCKNHTVTTVKAGTCSTAAVMRSTCNICGWSVDYEGSKGTHTLVEKSVHLSDYGPYTNELDATVSECTSCGTKSIIYHKGEGWSDYNRYRDAIGTTRGNAYAAAPVNDEWLYYDHPEWQMVKRDFVYDSEGYVCQYTQYWWYNGTRYSQVVKCGAGELAAWFAEYGLSGGDGYSYHLKVYGSYLAPYKVSYTG